MGRKYTVLFIEDIHDTIEGTISELEFQGYRVVTANSIKEGGTALKENEVDMIILDWWLPEEVGGAIIKNGGEIILNNLRSKEYGDTNYSTPVIICTNHLDHLNLYDRIPNELCSNILSKLTPPVDIINVIDSLLSSDD